MIHSEKNSEKLDCNDHVRPVCSTLRSCLSAQTEKPVIWCNHCVHLFRIDGYCCSSLTALQLFSIGLRNIVSISSRYLKIYRVTCFWNLKEGISDSNCILHEKRVGNNLEALILIRFWGLSEKLSRDELVFSKIFDSFSKYS